MPTSLRMENRNESSRILITIPGEPKGLEGYYCDDLSIGGRSVYGNPLESQMQESLSNSIQALQGFVSNVTGITYKVPSLRSIEQSVAVWNSTEKPSFEARLMFVCIREDQDVRKMVMTLYKTIYPTKTPFGGVDFLNAPLGYSPLPGADSTKNTCMVAIGKWFKCDRQIVTSVNFSFSKETIANGSPLFATGSISFEPYRMITYDEFKAYFPGVN